MIHHLSKLLVVALAMLITGCATIAPGTDSLVVRADQVSESLKVVIETYSSYEYRNRTSLYKVSPAFLEAANGLRREGMLAVDSLVTARTFYVTQKDLPAQQKLLVALQVAANLLSQGLNAQADAQAVLKDQEKK